MYILYGGQFTRASIVEMVLAEGDLDYELREVDIVKQEHRSPEYLAINPAGWVPALITPEGEVLYETPAITLYLAERHGLEDLVPRIDDPVRGAFLSGFFYLTDELEPALKRFFFPHRYVRRPEDTAWMKQQSLEAVRERLGVIEQRLDGAGPYHLGSRFSLIDLTLAFWTTSIAIDETLAGYPAVKGCVDPVMERPKLRQPFDQLRQSISAYAERLSAGRGVE